MSWLDGDVIYTQSLRPESTANNSRQTASSFGLKDLFYLQLFCSSLVCADLWAVHGRMWNWHMASVMCNFWHHPVPEVTSDILPVALFYQLSLPRRPTQHCQGSWYQSCTFPLGPAVEQFNFMRSSPLCFSRYKKTLVNHRPFGWKCGLEVFQHFFCKARRCAYNVHLKPCVRCLINAPDLESQNGAPTRSEASVQEQGADWLTAALTLSLATMLIPCLLGRMAAESRD